MSGNELRKKFLDFFEKRGHTVVPSSSLLSDDPSVLLTTAGMQQFKPYFIGQSDPVKDGHPGLGRPIGSTRATSIQKVFRTVDIDSVGDESHLTFFEMLGNFSFGDYFKERAIELSFEFITSQDGLGLDPSKLYITAFKGDDEVPRDDEAIKLWQERFKVVGIDANIDERIFLYGRKENWWEVGLGPAGPDAEMFYDTGKKHDFKFGSKCHPACDCGKFVEIGNDVFVQYNKVAEGKYETLDRKSVDNGRGFERLVMVVQDKSNIFETDLFTSIMNVLPGHIGKIEKRIISNHCRSIAFLICDGVTPSNKEAGYILRRLVRRVLINENVDFDNIFEVITKEYGGFYKELNKVLILSEFNKEKDGYFQTLETVLPRVRREIKRNINQPLTGAVGFGISSTFGISPPSILKEAREIGRPIDSNFKADFDKEFEKHQKVSRGGAGSFKGGLADHDPVTIRLHTAHHLLLAALQRVLGPRVKQRGSHITQKRLRIDFSYDKALTDEELKKVEDIVNQKIGEGLEVKQKEMPREEAEKIGAQMEFGAKYPDEVSVYFIREKDGNHFSKEFCGGPHVKNTSEIGKFKIIKQEASGAGVRRIRATVE